MCDLPLLGKISSPIFFILVLRISVSTRHDRKTVSITEAWQLTVYSLQYFIRL